MRVVVERRFESPPERVWDLLSDVPRMAGLSPEVVEATWVDDLTFVATNRRGQMEWTVTCHVVDRVRPARFAWCVSDPELRSSTWSYELVADGDGTLVRQEFRHGPGRSMVRMMIEEQGADAATTIAWREGMLASDMAQVLAAADALLSGPE